MNLEPICELVRWETPFADADYPSVYIVGDEGDEARELTVLVAPGGVDAYPKYLIRFRAVFAYLSEEESQWFAPGKGPEALKLAPNVKCSGMCLSGSTWWEAYGEQVRLYEKVEPAHFYLFGGDNNVEVFAAIEPSLVLQPHLGI